MARDGAKRARDKYDVRVEFRKPGTSRKSFHSKKPATGEDDSRAKRVRARDIPRGDISARGATEIKLSSNATRRSASNQFCSGHPL